MGAARFLCITIFLVFLASSALAASGIFATPDAGCSGHGFVVPGTAHCICQSGYTSSPSCDTHIRTVGTCASSAQNLSVAIDKNEHYPKLDTVTNKINFTENTIFASIAAPFVENRRYYDVKFVTSGSQTVADKCRLNTSASDSVWKLTAENSTCEDRLSLAMPWGDHVACGWTRRTGPNVPAEYYSYEVTVLLTYSDNIGTVGEEDALLENVERRSTVSFKLYVNFLKRIDVEMTDLVVYANTTISVFLTQFTYDPDTGRAHFTLVTSLEWPNMLYQPNMVQEDDLLSPPGTHVAEWEHSYISFTNTGCDMDFVTGFGTRCKQIIDFEVARLNSTLCSFDGEYRLNATRVTCRAEAIDCTDDEAPFSIFIKDSNVCGSVSAEPTVTAKLLGYSDADHLIPSDNFNMGEIGYFEIQVASENTVTFDFIDIWVQVDGTYTNTSGRNETEGNEKIYFLKDMIKQTKYKGVVNPAAQWDPLSPFANSIVDLHLSTEAGGKGYNVSVPGDGVQAYSPWFSFQFDGFVFKPEVSSWRIYDLHATAHVTYLSNEGYKNFRVVDFVYKADGAALSMAKKVYVNSKRSAAAEAPASNNSNQSLLTAILPVAGVALVVVVGAIIVAVVIVNKKKNTYTPFN